MMKKPIPKNYYPKDFINGKYIDDLEKYIDTKAEYLKAAELGEVSMIDAKHVVWLLDEARNEINAL